MLAVVLSEDGSILRCTGRDELSVSLDADATALSELLERTGMVAGERNEIGPATSDSAATDGVSMGQAKVVACRAANGGSARLSSFRMAETCAIGGELSCRAIGISVRAAEAKNVSESLRCTRAGNCVASDADLANCSTDGLFTERGNDDNVDRGPGSNSLRAIQWDTRGGKGIVSTPVWLPCERGEETLCVCDSGAATCDLCTSRAVGWIAGEEATRISRGRGNSRNEISCTGCAIGVDAGCDDAVGVALVSTRSEVSRGSEATACRPCGATERLCSGLKVL
jgi:hypothetical protein